MDNSSKKIGIALIVVVLLIIGAITSCTDKAETYYIDYNGNGECDWGEAQFYTDKDGTHWID